MPKIKSKEDFMETDEKASKSKKPFYRRWWFWLIIVVIEIIDAANSGNSTKKDTANVNSVSRQEQNNSKSVAKKTNFYQFWFCREMVRRASPPFYVYKH